MEVFKKYTDKFDFDNKQVERKYNHTIRVAALTKMLAQKLDYNEDDCNLAYLCGLYHDIGFFKQAKDYNTFDDYGPFDHGFLGYKIFLDVIAPKEDISSKDESLIAKVIMYHNKLNVPVKLSPRQKNFLDITRDADKIDVIYQMAMTNNFIKKSDEEVGKEVRLAFKEQKTIDKTLIKNNNDKIVYYLAYIYGLEYKESIKIIIENKYLDKIKARINDKAFDKYFREINKYIKEMN